MIRTHGLNHILVPSVHWRSTRACSIVREYFRDADGIQALGPGPHDVIAFGRREIWFE